MRTEDMRAVVERFAASGEKVYAIPCATARSAKRKSDAFFSIPRDERGEIVLLKYRNVLYLLNNAALGVRHGDV